MSNGSTQKLTLFALTAMVVGGMVGSGIFSLPRTFANATGPVGAIIAWLIAGTGMYMLARVFQALAERKPDLLCAVTSAPPLELGPGVSRMRFRLARGMRRIAPRLRLGAGIDSNDLTRDTKVARAYDDDPLVLKRATTSFAAEALETIVRTGSAGMHVQVPLLMLHGEADRVCPPRGSRAFHGQLRGPGHRLRVYPKLRHEIFNEPDQEQVFEDVLGWVQEREA